MRLTAVSLTVITLFLACAAPMPDQGGLSDIFEILEKQGYEANVGFAGIYEPGNVLQTKQEGGDGQAAALASPIVFSWGSDCFPRHSPRISPFVLPDSQGSQANSISIGASVLSLLVPSLKFNRQTLANYRLDFENTQVHTFAKGDLSRRFSEKCVQALAQAVEDGDNIEWFAIIIEAVIADAMTLEMNWQSGSSLDARAAQRNQIMGQLGSILNGYSDGMRQSGAGLALAQDNEKRSVIKTTSPLIVGYRIRPLQPVYQK